MEDKLKNDEYKNTLDFLDNYGRLRNCVHSNYIFQGLDQKDYEFNNVNFKYKS